MKTLKDVINGVSVDEGLRDIYNREKFRKKGGSYKVNIIICASGSMSFAKDELNYLEDVFPRAKYFIYDVTDDAITEIESIKNFKSGGPHPGDLDTVANFLGKHLGELNIYIQN